MPLIQLENVSYRYNQVTALSEVSLQVQQGEFVAIIGPNGSGKSTLAQLLNALLLPSGEKSGLPGSQPQMPQAARFGRSGGEWGWSFKTLITSW